MPSKCEVNCFHLSPTWHTACRVTDRNPIHLELDHYKTINLDTDTHTDEAYQP